ncbi:MAG: hypothetical protein JWP12_3630 [Bacteroidetes bacterium]|nr:hypothetical protein [Bacteroidota bacterium]
MWGVFILGDLSILAEPRLRMKTPNLKRSFAVIIILTVFIIAAHVLTLFNMDQTPTAIIIYLVLLLFNIFYFIQLRNNLNKLLSITNVNYKINAIIISYVVTILVIIAFAIINRDTPKPKPDALHISLLSIYLIAFFNSVVQYCILGYRLTKNISFPYIKTVGYLYLFLKPFADIVGFFIFFSSLKMYSQLSIFSEVIPLWLVYKQYKELIAKENQNKETSFITNAGVINHEDERGNSTEHTA